MGKKKVSVRLCKKKENKQKKIFSVNAFSEVNIEILIEVQQALDGVIINESGMNCFELDVFLICEKMVREIDCLFLAPNFKLCIVGGDD